MDTKKASKELRLAELIVSVLPAGSVMRICSDDRNAIRFAVRAEAMKLREVVLCRASLRRLLEDPAADVKIEYLQRDLGRLAARRTQFRYPREIRRVSKKRVKGPAVNPAVVLASAL